jgi:hypothetical protein
VDRSPNKGGGSAEPRRRGSRPYHPRNPLPAAAGPANQPAERPRPTGPAEGVPAAYWSAPSSRSTRRTIASDDAYVESIP